MALDIGIGDGTTAIPVPGEPALALHDDWIYWFLHPLLERLRAETGQYVDLYGDASFPAEKLDALDRLLRNAKLEVAKARELHGEAGQARLLGLIARWEAVVARARELGRPVVCFGD